MTQGTMNDIVTLHVSKFPPLSGMSKYPLYLIWYIIKKLNLTLTDEIQLVFFYDI
jgi:hypothetical protein